MKQVSHQFSKNPTFTLKKRIFKVFSAFLCEMGKWKFPRTYLGVLFLPLVPESKLILLKWWTADLLFSLKDFQKFSVYKFSWPNLNKTHCTNTLFYFFKRPDISFHISNWNFLGNTRKRKGLWISIFIELSTTWFILVLKSHETKRR